MAKIDTSIAPRDLFNGIPNRFLREAMDRHNKAFYDPHYNGYQPDVGNFLSRMNASQKPNFEGKFQEAINALVRELRNIERHPGDTSLHGGHKYVTQQLAGARIVYDTLANAGKRLNVNIPNLKFGEHNYDLNNMFRHIEPNLPIGPS